MKGTSLVAYMIFGGVIFTFSSLLAADQGSDGAVDRPAPEQEAHIHELEEDMEWGPCPDFMPDGCGIAVLQGDPGEENADVLFRMAPDTTVPEHWHTSAERMVLVAGEMVVDYEGQDPVRLTPGTYAYGPAGLPHVTHCESDEECLLFIAFEEPVDAHPHD